MALSYGTDGSLTVRMEGPFGNVGSAVKLASFTAPAEGWKGAVSPYSQVVEVPGVSVNSKVDIQLSVEQLNLLHSRDMAFTTENDGGVVTLYAIGDKPETDLTLQATVTEVIA